jgi:epoxyqueuosine reductase
MTAEASLEDRVKRFALAEGAAAVGIARVDDAAAGLAHGRLRRWLAEGFAGEMGYLAGQESRRADPRLSLPGARALIAAAYDYAFPEEDAAHEARRSASGAGRVARYARGRDYHRILPGKLRRVLAFLEAERPGTRGRVYVDTGPVLERAWAARAGLGWVGKHSLLLRRDGGSWFLLGVILVDCDLAADAPAEPRCGSCARCLDACPTGAIVAPYQVDARRCISYLTIELRGPIPRPLRALVGDRIFGCDDCQDACPWNEHAAAARLDDLRARPDLLETPLADWLDLGPEDFRARFAGRPIARARRDGFLRNVCVALGNAGRPEAAPALARALARDPSGLVRAHAAWALGRLGGEVAREALAGAARADADAGVRAEARAALLEAPGPAAPVAP